MGVSWVVRANLGDESVDAIFCGIICARKAAIMKNLHVPLPESLYMELRMAADRTRRPATTLARQAIELWLRQSQRAARHRAIAAFAAESAGTKLDLDPDLEAASAEHLAEFEQEGR
jgi:hypothetical protein